MYRDAEAILSRIDLRRLYPEAGGTTDVKTHCPFHNDSGKPNLAINRDYTYCFACGAHETALAHVMRVRGLTSYAKAWEVVEAELLTDTAIERNTEAPAAELSKADALAYARKLAALPSAQGWLTERYGLSFATQKAARLGFTGRAYSIPIYNLSGQLINIRFRAAPGIETANKYWGVTGHNAPAWYIPPPLLAVGYGADTLAGLVRRATGKNSVVLTEGELDALALVQEGIPAIGNTDGARALLGSNRGMVEALRGLQVLVAYDMDNRGLEAGREVVERLHAAGIYGKRLVWPARLGKDATEVLVNTGAASNVIPAHRRSAPGKF